MRLAASVAALHERIHGDRRKNRNQNERADREPEQTPMAAGRGGPLRLELPFRLVLRPPGQHRLGEDVVEDLVARALCPVFGGTNYALFDEALKHALGFRLPDRRVAGEIAGPVGDFHARWGDEMVVHRGGSVLLLRRELCHCPFQVILDDVRRAAELAQGLQPEPVRASARLDLPEPLEDELKVRSLDPVGALLADGAASGKTQIDASGSHLVQHGLHELGRRLDAASCGNELVVALERTEDRSPSGTSLEPVEPQRVPEQVRDASLERVQARQRILADPDEEVDAQPGSAQRFRQFLRERSGAAFVLVIEEVLLELVEDDVKLGIESPRPRGEHIGERPASTKGAGIFARRGFDGVEQIRHRVARPGREDDHHGMLLAPQTMGDAGLQKRRFADAARPVEDSQARGHQIRDDHLDLAFAPEEEQSVEFGVVEGRQPLVWARRCRDRTHAEASASSRPAWRASPST